jgi:hypothetical protein
MGWSAGVSIIGGVGVDTPFDQICILIAKADECVRSSYFCNLIVITKRLLTPLELRVNFFEAGDELSAIKH